MKQDCLGAARREGWLMDSRASLSLGLAACLFLITALRAFGGTRLLLRSAFLRFQCQGYTACLFTACGPLEDHRPSFLPFPTSSVFVFVFAPLSPSHPWLKIHTLRYCICCCMRSPLCICKVVVPKAPCISVSSTQSAVGFAYRTCTPAHILSELDSCNSPVSFEKNVSLHTIVDICIKGGKKSSILLSNYSLLMK